ncbi:MAG: nickel pincer cofactor biosynthesis protein LarC [Nitrospirae bacterium]|nr:nickel pincer cofactor biosynthesis protein LarC [Nitrospirota bacterium]
MRIAYFDCFSGISGDMSLGALVDAGAPLDKLREGLNAMDLVTYDIRRRKVKRGGISATKIEVVVKKDEPTRSFDDISTIIEDSDLPPNIKKSGLRIFRRLFQAERRVHGGRLKDLHLHELSATDCIVDIIGTLLCLKILGIKEVVSSPLNLGGGTVSSEHGLLPVPAPATVQLLKGKPVFSTGIQKELTTPTGAAIITETATSFGHFPEMTIDSTGTGAGGHILKEQPNILRVFIGNKTIKPHKGHHKRGSSELVTVIETNIDDMNPQVYEYLMERLFKEGALDVFLNTVIMKKSRPGILLQVIAYPATRERLVNIMFEETPTLGIRFHETERIYLEREIKEMDTEFGPVRFKVVDTDGYRKAVPEYEDCRRIAEKTGLSLIDVMKMLKS